jgi:hypothetical protein
MYRKHIRDGAFEKRDATVLIFADDRKKVSFAAGINDGGGNTPGR